jgi:hypothetical protein
MGRSPRHTGVRTPSFAYLAQHSLQSGSGLGRDLLPPLSAVLITIAQGTMLEPCTHAEVECALHLNRLDHPLPHSRAIGENSEFRHSDKNLRRVRNLHSTARGSRGSEKSDSPGVVFPRDSLRTEQEGEHDLPAAQAEEQQIAMWDVDPESRCVLIVRSL